MIKINRNNINVITISIKLIYIIKINFDRVLLKSKYHIIHIINNNFNEFSIIYILLLN